MNSSSSRTRTSWLMMINLLMMTMVIAQQSTTYLDIGGVFPILTTTGAVDPVGVMRQAGFIMAINEINNKTDGIFDDILPDVHVRYGVRDSLHTFQNSVLAAIDLTQQQFLPNGVSAVIGAGDNSVTEALAAILSKTNTPQISYGSGATELSHSDQYPTHLRVYPSDAFQGTAMADIMAKTLKFKRVIVFASTTSLGSDSILEFAAGAKSNNVNILMTSANPTGTTDFSTAIAAALPYDCRAFAFLTEFPADAGYLLMQGYEAGLFNVNTTIYFNEALQVPQTYTAFVAKHGVQAMRGVLSLSSMIQGWKASDNGQVFLTRYINQPNSVTILPNGTQVCHLDKDDTGEYLYKSLDPFSKKYRCTGFQFNTLHQDGHDGSTYMGFIYDATLAYFHAVDFLLKTKQITLDQLRTKNTPLLSGTNIKSVLANNVSFSGVTGKVSFSKGIAGSKIYGYGDRATNQGFVIYNWQYTNTSIGVFQRVARWTSELGYMDCLHDTYNIPIPSWMGGCHLPISYNSPDGLSVPVDHLEDYVMVVPLAIRAFLLAIAVITFVTALFTIIVLFVFKAKARLVKASQPLMMMYILVGIIFAAIRIASAGFDPTEALCHVDIWSGHLSFAFVFFGMMMKQWRVFKIVLGGLKRVKITTSQVMSYTAVLISIVIIILILYSAIGRPYVEIIYTPLITGNNMRHKNCTTSMPGFDYVLYAIEASALLYAFYLIHRTRDAPDAVNESKAFSWAVFLIAFIGIAGLPIVYLLSLEPYLAEMVTGVLYFIATFGANGFYFGQKLFYLLQGADLNAQFKIVLANGKSLGGRTTDKSTVKRAAAMGKMLVNSLKNSTKSLEEGSSRKRSMNSMSLNDASDHNVGSGGSSSIPDSEKELQNIFDLIEPNVKAAFLSVEVPSGCSEKYSKERIALWTFFHYELEKKNARQGLYDCDEGSVHDDEWVQDFVEMSRTASIENDLNESGKAPTEADATPPLKEKIKNSGSTNSLLGLLSLV